jgi:hypothetical protein
MLRSHPNHLAHWQARPSLDEAPRSAKLAKQRRVLNERLSLLWPFFFGSIH